MLFNNSFKSGGPAALHALCHNIPFGAAIFTSNPYYASQYDGNFDCVEVDIHGGKDGRNVKALDPQDIIIVPEKMGRWQCCLIIRCRQAAS